jgi:hypothetical protein
MDGNMKKILLNKALNKRLQFLFPEKIDYVLAFGVVHYIHVLTFQKNKPEPSFVNFGSNRANKLSSSHRLRTELNNVIKKLVSENILLEEKAVESSNPAFRKSRKLSLTKESYIIDDVVQYNDNFSKKEIQKILSPFRVTLHDQSKHIINIASKFKNNDERLVCERINKGEDLDVHNISMSYDERYFTLHSILSKKTRQQSIDLQTGNLLSHLDSSSLQHYIILNKILTFENCKPIDPKELEILNSNNFYEYFMTNNISRQDVKDAFMKIYNTADCSYAFVKKEIEDISKQRKYYYISNKLINDFPTFYDRLGAAKYYFNNNDGDLPEHLKNRFSYVFRKWESEIIEKHIMRQFKKENGRYNSIIRVHDCLAVSNNKEDNLKKCFDDNEIKFKVEFSNNTKFSITDIAEWIIENYVTKTDEHIICSFEKVKSLKFCVKNTKKHNDEYILEKVKSKLQRIQDRYNEKENKNNVVIQEEVIATTQPEVKAVEVIEVPEATDNDFHIQDIFNTSKSAVVGAMLDIYNTPTIGVDTVNVAEHKEIKRVIVQRQRSYELPELTDDMKKICVDRLNENKNKIPFRDKKELVKDYCEKHNIYYVDDYNFILGQYYEMLELGD